MNQLVGQKIRLRALEPSDAELLYKWENDTSIWHLGNTNAPLSLHKLKAFIDSDNDIYTQKQLRLMIDNKEGRTVGAIDLFDFTPEHRRAGVGILIADDSDRKKGYGSEALDLLIKFAFNQIQLKQLFCNVLEGNEASIKLFKSRNFEVCGSKKDWIKIKSDWLTEHMLQLISDND